MRDALSLLDQCIAFNLGDGLTYDKVLDVLGAVDTEVFSRLLRCVLEQNVPGCAAAGGDCHAGQGTVPVCDGLYLVSA